MNVANNVVFIPKKPTGYVASDFMSPKCFLTLDQLNAANGYEAVKRNSTDELPAFYYVSKKLYDDAIALPNIPDTKGITYTDDYLAQNLFRVVDYLNGTQNPIEGGRTATKYLLARIKSTTDYEVGILNNNFIQNNNIQYNLETVKAENMGYILAVDHFEAWQAAVQAGPPADEIQTVSFSAVPDLGSFTLIFDGNETAPIAFNALAATIQTELQTAGMTTAVVSGTIAAGLTVTVSGLGNVTELLVGSNSLTALAVPVNILIATSQEGN